MAWAAVSPSSWPQPVSTWRRAGDLVGAGPAAGHRRGRKSDDADALSVAHVALHRADLRQVTAEDQATILRLPAERREDLAAERTRTLNRLHTLLRDLVPGGAPSPVGWQGRRVAAHRPSGHRDRGLPPGAGP